MAAPHKSVMGSRRFFCYTIAMTSGRLSRWLTLMLLWAGALTACTPLQVRAQVTVPAFTFAIAADPRFYSGAGQYDTPQYFRGALQALSAAGKAAFLISPGNIDPPAQARWTIDEVLGSSYQWYPLVGNHELPGAGQESAPGANLAWLKAYDTGLVNPGPPGCPTTTYSFDTLNSHFVMLNEFCDAGGDATTNGDISDHLYAWLADDLASHPAAHTFVLGAMPAYPQPDQDTGRVRHETDSLNQHAEHRDRFWNLLHQANVTAYLCGYTHNYSAVRIDGVWQIDVGHASGLGDPGTPSTIILVKVNGAAVNFQAYRDDGQGGAYHLRHSGMLAGWRTLLPFSHLHSFNGRR